MSNCERCGEVNPAELHTCTPEEKPVAEAPAEQAPEVEINHEPAIMLALQSFEYAGNLLQALPFTKLHPVAMQLLTILTGIFTHEILASVKKPVDAQ